MMADADASYHFEHLPRFLRGWTKDSTW